jgi:hypothetical protein
MNDLYTKGYDAGVKASNITILYDHDLGFFPVADKHTNIVGNETHAMLAWISGLHRLDLQKVGKLIMRFGIHLASVFNLSELEFVETRVKQVLEEIDDINTMEAVSNCAVFSFMVYEKENTQHNLKDRIILMALQDIISYIDERKQRLHVEHLHIV